MATESSSYITSQDNLSQSQSNSLCSDDSVKAKLAQIPKVTEPEFRIACDEIAESLSKKWRFKFHIIGMIVVAVIIITGSIAGIFGWTIKDQFHNIEIKLDKLMETEVFEAKAKVDKFIEAEFQKENIKKTIQQVASDQSVKLIQDLIQPSVISSEKRIRDFNQYLVDQKKTVDKNMSTLQEEVGKLQERNNITALADKAIAQGDLHAFSN